jgi:hypothetical protein
MRRSLPLIAAAAMLLASCAGMIYTRIWTYNNDPLTDQLTVTDETFRLERSSSAGVAVFEGDLKQGDGRWTFDVVRWKPYNAAAQTFDPPVRYVYRVRESRGMLSFTALEDVRGWSPMQFIPPGDFKRGRCAVAAELPAPPPP